MPSYYPNALPQAWQRAFVIIARVSASLSIFGSSWILLEVLRDKKKRGRVYHRLLLGMSSYDLASSLAIFLSSWMMPSWSWYGAVGNGQTCMAQGFFVAIGLASPIYNASLSLYYLLQLRYGWKDDRFAKRVEGWVHGLAATVAVSFSFVALFLRMYHPVVLPYCFIGYPIACDVGDFDGCDEYSSWNAFVIFALAFYGVVWLCTILAGVCMMSVYMSVRRLEQRVKRYDFPGSNSDKEKAKQSTQVAINGILYMSVYFLTWTAPSVGMVIARMHGQGWILERGSQPGWRALMTCWVALVPLQGFLNFLIYIRPRFVKYAKQNPDWPTWRVLGKVLRRALNLHVSDDDHTLGTVSQD